jgi:hypothetical protein
VTGPTKILVELNVLEYNICVISNITKFLSSMIKFEIFLFFEILLYMIKEPG